MTEKTHAAPAPTRWADAYQTVGVTGTNGKTSTTTLVAWALRAAGHHVLTETTLGYAFDDEPLEVERSAAGCLSALEACALRGARNACIEVTSEALARGFAQLWRFDVGVFTNLSHEHLNVHGSAEHYLASKAQLFVRLSPGGAAILNACDSASPLLAEVTPPDVERRWYAVRSRGEPLHAADLAASHVSLSVDGTRVELEPGPTAEALGGVLEVTLVGEVFAENALAAALAALATGAPPDAVREGLRRCPGVPGRFQIVTSSPIVAVDYAHTPDALARTCDAARALAGAGRVIVVFGAGGGRDPDKRAPMGRAVGDRADIAVITSDNPRDEDPSQIAGAVAAGARRGGRAHVRIELDRRRAIGAALDEARPGDVVIVAGKGHETGQTARGETLPFDDAQVVREVLGSATLPA